LNRLRRFFLWRGQFFFESFFRFFGGGPSRGLVPDYVAHLDFRERHHVPGIPDLT
jgi:hypothetical protein